MLLLLLCPVFNQAQTSLEEVKKEANKLFEDDEFTQAYKFYSQLVANYPKDPEYNYRLGVCMIYSEPDKKKCLPFLKSAAANPKEAPKDVNFYLGKAYHINYLFDEAIKCYNAFKSTASSSLQKKLQVDREIKACAHGKLLLSNLTDLVIQSKKSLNELDYFRSYDLRTIGGKLLVKPDEFKSSIDKKKKEKSVVFLPKGSNVVYYSSYGETPESGKDIYTIAKLPSGQFGKPQKVAGINTEFDEDFPFLHPDGKTLYFASKGHNSMGGYDIFKTVFNEETNSWSKPENLEFPVNSPDDDFLFVTDSLEKTAFFSTGRQSPPGKIDVLKVSTLRKPIDVLAIKGKVLKENANQSVNSIISIKNTANEEAIGTYNAQDNGDYALELPNGAKLLFTVETPGLKTQTEEVELPLATRSKPYAQTITYENGTLKIITQENASEESYLQYLKLIEKKARLDVNEGENKLNAIADSSVAKNKKDVKPQLLEEHGGAAVTTNNPTTKPTTNVDNKQLAKLAEQDAEESLQEAEQMKRDAADAYETGRKQNEEADKKLAEANDALKGAETISNEEEKNAMIARAEELKKSGENDKVVAEKILGYAKSLETDAATKLKEAELNKQYANELEKSLTAKDKKEALQKIESLQQQIATNSEQKKESENVVNSIKTDIEQKENELTKLEKINTDIKSNINEISTVITETEDELSKTKKKSIKAELNQKIEGLKTDKTEKEKQIKGNDIEIAKVNEELNTLKNELDLTTRIKTDDIVAKPAANATPTAPIVKDNTPTENTPNASVGGLSSKNLKEKYAVKIAVNNPSDKVQLESSISELKNFNTEIEQSLNDNRTKLNKTKQAAEKQKINAEIKQLDALKKQNQQLIAQHNGELQKLNAPVAQANGGANDAKSVYTPISATNSNDAVSKLNTLEKQLVFNDNDNFDFNSYQNPAAQALKVEADARINDAIARQKKLKDEIAASKTTIQNSGNDAGTSTLPVVSGNADELNKEAEAFHNQAIARFNESKTKSGAEKEKLMAESKELEEKSNLKHIDIAEITKNENTATFTVNSENIDNLIKENKAGAAEVTEARQLYDDAQLAFKKSQEIRSEVSAQASSGAKLGILSNAEEKEAEAILKQQQAIDLLKKSNPDFVLKTVNLKGTSNPTANNSGNSDINSKLSGVNEGLNELANIKIESYNKLSQANLSEGEELTTTIKNSQAVLDANPVLKSEFIAANKKLEAADEIKKQSEKTDNGGEKLSLLVASIKKQNEGIKQLSALNNNLAKQSATTTAVTSNTETPAATTPTLATTTETISSAQNPNTANNTVTATPNETVATTTTEPATAQPTTATVDNTTQTGNGDKPGSKNLSQEQLRELAKNDTTTAQTLSYLNETTPELNNPQANTNFKQALNRLKNYEADAASIDKKLNSANNTTDGGTEQAAIGAQELKSKSDVLLVESDELSTLAQQIRKEAQQKEGAEKDSLLSRVKDLETKSLDRSIEGATLLFQSNEIDVASNAAAIDELLAKMRNDNPELSVDLAAKKEEQNNLKSQIQKLREEAESQNNKAAKLGAINNAEERELELLAKQEQLIAELKKQYPDYVIKPLNTANFNSGSSEPKEVLLQKKKEVRDNQFAELTNLTNAFSLEFESNKNKLPKNPDADGQKAKQSVLALNTESKRLLIKSAQEKNEGEKLKLLNQSVKLGNEAIVQLNKLIPKGAATNNTVVPVAGTNTVIARPDNNRPTTTPTTAVRNQTVANEPANNPGTFRTGGIEVRPGNAYTDARPIPMNAKVQDGLIFRVQIGAFKTQLPNNAFKGLNPLNGETTANGYFRYTAGNFVKYEGANAVKNDLRNLGYTDAFVVAYYNGKRITLGEALDLLKKEGKTIDVNAPESAGITANYNIPRAALNPAIPPQRAVVVSNELEKVNGLLYTIQIGVYNRQVTGLQLKNLKPIFTEQLEGGLFRYTAGIYNNTERLIADKAKVVNLGIKDAFISAYLNGKKIPFAEAKTKQSSDSTIKMEAQDPIIFPSGDALNTDVVPANIPANNNPAPAIQPFSNGVSAYPAATAENGVKANESGVSFKVQIGAYSKQVPADVSAKFLSIKTWPIENKQANGLFIYNIGNFTEAKFAKQLKDEVIRLGLNDAFITVYKDGKKLYGAEASGYLSR
ncbi:MAG: PD40 domain-containing protein [Bacteroidia bacterium]|nr:PD40 domain-containing protein [Bacteroidia bacterium]